MRACATANRDPLVTTTAVVRQGRAIGLNRWPSRHWRINKAWTQIVLLAGNLLAAYRWLALEPGHLRDASVKLLRFRLFDLPAQLTRGQRKRRLHLRADPRRSAARWRDSTG